MKEHQCIIAHKSNNIKTVLDFKLVYQKTLLIWIKCIVKIFFVCGPGLDKKVS